MVGEILVTKAFEEALQRHRHPNIVYKTIRLLLENPGYPSLKAHRLVQAREGIWICYVSDGDRILYEFKENSLYLWNLGGHDIERVDRQSFPTHTAFTSPPMPSKITEPLPVVELPPSPSKPLPAIRPQPEADAFIQMGSPNHFAHFQVAHLRILGVPTHLIQDVRDAPSLEDVCSLPGLPARTRLWLEELSTSPDHAAVIYDSSRLLFRTTLDRLDGFCEGKIKRLMLNLQHPEQQQYVDMKHAPLILLKGVAGSGKTTVGVYRAIRLAKEGRRVLVLTFNPILASATQSLIEELIGPLPTNLRVMHLHELMRMVLAERLPGVRIKEEKECLSLLDEALAEVRKKVHSPLLQRDRRFFQEEIKYVIKGFGINSLAAYKNVERYGRKTAFGPSYREIMWQVYEAYKRRFPAQVIDYLDIAVRTLDVLRKQPMRDRYDDIIVDESQDLTLIDLRIAQELLAAPTHTSAPPGSLMILADAAQTLYSRGFSWRQAGIQARGRTAILRKNYRNTRQIADAAAQLLKHNTILHALGEYVDPEWTQRQGAPPFLMRATSHFNSIELVRDRILDLVSDQTFRLADFAILCPTEQLCELCEQVLKSVGLRTIQHKHPRFDLLDECIKIMPIHSAKGLEFPVVFLLGLTNDLLPSRRGLQHADAEEARLYVEQQRALCYVGMTRAADALYLLTVNGAESLFIQELAGKVTLWQE